MASLIKELVDLPIDGQEFVLSQMMDDYRPIELNGRVFLIPKEVDDFISNLYLKNKKIKKSSKTKDI
tara:strand:+ start:2898 stop:3098 length:201 start_codon:yes stop_codon:yes gene_type:complete